MQNHIILKLFDFCPSNFLLHDFKLPCICFSLVVLPPVLVPRQSEFPRPPGPMPYHMQHMSSVHGMPGNAGFPPSFQRPTPGPGELQFFMSRKLLLYKIFIQVESFS